MSRLSVIETDIPEEIYRRVASVIADRHFAPTPSARANLLNEGVPRERIHLTGNTVVDALLRIARDNSPATDPALREIIGSGRRLVLLTAHRRESFGRALREAFGAVRELADRHPEIVVLYPVHPNPHVREAVDTTLLDHPRIRLTEPLQYRDLVRALRAAELVLTDSGGIQEEAPTFGTPVLVMREVTERPEGIEAGVATLVGTDRTRILAAAELLLTDRTSQTHGVGRANPYGDGRASERIADIVVHTLTNQPRETTDWQGHIA
jgi:UDP-N-acetylglucosamine 2-epimerase (non-hydrolysing)